MMIARLALPALLLCACNPPAMPPAPPSPTVTPQVSGQVIDTASAELDKASVPAAFHGKWDATLAACTTASEMRLTVEPKALRFWESHGEVESVSFAGPQAATVRLAMSGEGETWERDVEMALMDDGALALDGVKRVRCP